MSNAEIRKQVTEQLLQAMEKGVLPWRKPWTSSPNSGRAINVDSNRHYRGINPLLLNMASTRHGFQSRYWGTFQQWKNRGMSVRRRPHTVQDGEWGCRIVFYKPITKTVRRDGEEHEERFFMLRTYTVFNADQVDGAERFQVQETAPTAPSVSFERADMLIEATGAHIVHGGSAACYVPPTDTIHMPRPHTFDPQHAYYTTLLHELCHWSEKRVGWERKGDSSYAMGELIAEMGSCFLATELGIPMAEGLGNHASYLHHWVGQMKNDADWIFKASRQASTVTDYLLGLRQSETTVTEEELVPT
jgi:antirestriction protein ArdC